MNLRLREGVSWCLCNGRAAFMDLAGDRYFCLPPELDAAFLCWAAGDAASADPSMLDRLRSCGLLVAGAPDEGARISMARPARDLAIEAAGEARLTSIVTAGLAQYRAARLVRRRSLSGIIDRLILDRAASIDANASVRRARALAAAFAAAALWLPTADRCLARAIAMRRACNRNGIHAALVFGVRLDPFAAHCWVQIGDAVLIGDLEEARLFVPILVVP